MADTPRTFLIYRLQNRSILVHQPDVEDCSGRGAGDEDTRVRQVQPWAYSTSKAKADRSGVEFSWAATALREEPRWIERVWIAIDSFIVQHRFDVGHYECPGREHILIVKVVLNKLVREIDWCYGVPSKDLFADCVDVG
jgi:hypothetical protein